MASNPHLPLKSRNRDNRLLTQRSMSTNTRPTSPQVPAPAGLKSTGLGSLSSSSSKSNNDDDDSSDLELITPYPGAELSDDEGLPPGGFIGTTAKTGNATATTSVQPTTTTSSKKSPISRLTLSLSEAMKSKLAPKSAFYNTAACQSAFKPVVRNRNAIIAAAAKVKQQAPDLYNRASDRKVFPSSTKIKDSKETVVNNMISTYAVLYELLQCSNHGLSRAVMSKLQPYLEIMEDVLHACRADAERDRAKKVNDKLGKSVNLGEEKRRRKFLQEGGKAWRQDGGDPVDCCPCCGLKKLFDKEPDYDKNKKINKDLSKEYQATVAQVKACKAGKASQPVGKDGKPLKKVDPPKWKPQLLHCHHSQNYESVSATGQRCHFGCNYDGVSYSPGTCPSCKSSCSFIWDRLKHADILSYFQIKRVTGQATSTEREEANEYLTNLRGLE